MSRSLGSRIAGALSRAGSAAAKALSSNTARTLYRTLGNTANRVVNSELGQRAISGLVEGAVNSAVTGDPLGDSLKKAVILNVAGVHAPPIDPLNPAEGALQRQLQAIDAREVADSKAIMTIAGVERVIGSELQKISELEKIESRRDELDERAVETVTSVVAASQKLIEMERKQLQRLSKALTLEDSLRTEDDRKLIACMKHNFSALAANVESERKALIEEAVEQSIDIGGEIAEHAAASVPFVGESIATGMATARGAMQVYKLGKTISQLTGMHTAHMELPAIHQGALEVAHAHPEPTSDAALAQVISSRLAHVHEIEKEWTHVDTHIAKATDEVSKDIKKKMCDHLCKKADGRTENSHHLQLAAATATRVSSNAQPTIQILTSAWDSDAVLIFYVVGPYHTGDAFVLCVDLALDLVLFEDSRPPTHPHRISHRGNARAHPAIIADFFRMVAGHPEVDAFHARRIGWSVTEAPIRVQAIPYSASFSVMRRNAQRLASDATLQRMLLKGPRSMQRVSLLNALQHGAVVLTRTRRTPLPPTYGR
uniref:Outer capsid protein VP5 n=1 Tax=Guangdong tick orbivirus TaxID=2998222 RepID=A0A9E8S6H6_9REOV|nr:outer capsid protein 2 [Guangdong tick orbivirus]